MHNLVPSGGWREGHRQPWRVVRLLVGCEAPAGGMERSRLDVTGDAAHSHAYGALYLPTEDLITPLVEMLRYLF